MKYRTVQERIGENLGPVDWNYDFYANPCGRKKEDIDRQIALFRSIQLGDEITTYGGWPRCGWGEVVEIGMYDGWPAWSPTPSVCMTERVLGGVTWEPWYAITDIRKAVKHE
jgi:hypothetical protein